MKKTEITRTVMKQGHHYRSDTCEKIMRDDYEQHCANIVNNFNERDKFFYIKIQLIKHKMKYKI